MNGRTLIAAVGAVLLIVLVVIATKNGAGDGGNPGGDPGSGSGSTAGGQGSKGGLREGPGRREVPERNPMDTLYENERYTEVQGMAREWIGRALQQGNPEERQAVIEELREALEGTDELAVFAALEALQGLKDVKFDRAGLRERILPHLEAPNGRMRRAAWYALVTTEIKPGMCSWCRGW